MVKSKKEKKEVTEEKPLPPAKSIFEVKATSGRARLGELASALPTPAFTQLTSRGMPQCLRPEQDKEEVEAEWPEYKNSLLMLTRPTYQMDAEMTPAAWKQQCSGEVCSVETAGGRRKVGAKEMLETQKVMRVDLVASPGEEVTLDVTASRRGQRAVARAAEWLKDAPKHGHPTQVQEV
eukprot:g25919.t1